MIFGFDAGEYKDLCRERVMRGCVFGLDFIVFVFGLDFTDNNFNLIFDLVERWGVVIIYLYIIVILYISEYKTMKNY